jgi:hypothetical protein
MLHPKRVATGDNYGPAVGRMTDGNGFRFLWEAMARRELRLDACVQE